MQKYQMKMIPIKIQKKNNILLFSGIPYYRKTNCKLYQKLDDYMDAAQTKTRDFSKYGNHGTVYGAIPSTSEPTGFYFDGTDDYIDCGNDSSLDITDAITIEAWVKSSVSQNKYILSKAGSTNKNYAVLLYTDGSCRGMMFDDSGTGVAEATAPAGSFSFNGTFHHIVYTYDGSYGKIYVNGNLKDTSDLYTGTIGTTTDHLEIGKRLDNYFNGTIALVRIYKILNENAIKNHYENERNIFGV